MIRSGLIVNPRSGKSSAKGPKLAQRLNEQSTVDTVILDDFTTLSSHLTAMAQNGVTRLFISSGDGTVQAIQTLLVENKIFSQLPELCLLPHGTTNMTATTLGLIDKTLDSQFALISGKKTAQKNVLRHTLRVANPADGKPRHGMFLGTGAVSRAAEFCQTDIHATGLKGDWATFATMFTALSRAMISTAGPQDEHRLDKPWPIKITTNGKLRADGLQLLALVTTLEKLILNSAPFWGGATAPLRTTILPYPPPSIMRYTKRLLYGDEQRQPAPGCVSFATSSISLTTPSRFILDGEFFDAPANAPLNIETGPQFSYIRG